MNSQSKLETQELSPKPGTQPSSRDSRPLHEIYPFVKPEVFEIPMTPEVMDKFIARLEETRLKIAAREA